MTMVLQSPQAMTAVTSRRPRISAGVRRHAPRRSACVAPCLAQNRIVAQPGFLGANPAEIVLPAQTISKQQIVALSHAFPTQALPTAPVMARMPVRFQSGGTDPKRILCYGDSLTAGFCNSGEKFEPYGRTLADMMGRSGIACEVSVCGLSGRTAEEMIAEKDSAIFTDCAALDHVGKGLARILDDDGKPDVVVILAGTNDLGFAGFTQGLTAKHILSRVQQLHLMCHQRGISTIALIPPCSTQGPMRLMQQQLAVMLANWVQTERQVLTLYDVEELVPRQPSGRFWDSDEIHMSVAGQSMLGQLLAQFLPPVVGASDKTIQSARATQQLPVCVDSDPTTVICSARSGKAVVGGFSPSAAMADSAATKFVRPGTPTKLVGSPILRFRAFSA